MLAPSVGVTVSRFASRLAEPVTGIAGVAPAVVLVVAALVIGGIWLADHWAESSDAA